MSQETNKAQYANWISKKMVVQGGVFGGIVLAGAVLVTILQGHVSVLGIIIGVVGLAICGLTLYMGVARRMLAYDGGQVQSKVLDSVLGYLDTLGWDGRGKLLDVGCGSGAMCVKAAKKYPEAKITGIDYWGGGWEFSKALCENNAKADGVAERVVFLQGDAAKLPFADESFDAAVSNFVFHEVRTQPDKLALIREALRTVKPGGVFAFQDIMFEKKHYGDRKAMMDALKREVSEIHFVDTRKPAFAPAWLNTAMVLGQMGLIYGRR